ncbi:MAG TPA: hypothetical protein VGQ83_33655 [Polyangia bacterium]
MKRSLFVLFPVGVLALHLGLTFYFMPPRAVFNREPIFTIDHILHYGQVVKVAAAHRQSGHFWAYDPSLLAGQPEGVVLDADNKGVELGFIALTRLGLPAGLAFNLLLLLIQLAVPFAGYGAARLFGLGRRAACVAALLFVLLWFFDFFLHWCWYCGMYSYAAVSYLCAVTLGLMYRLVRGGGPGTAVGLAAALAATLVVHPLAFLVLVGPMIALYVRAARGLAAWRHGAVWAAAAATIGASLWWLPATLRFMPQVEIRETGYYLQTTLSYLLTDSVDVLQDAYETGAFGVRTAFRLVVFVGAVGGLIAWRRRRDDRFLPFALVLGWLFALSYLGGYTKLTRQVQPYRHMAPLTLLAALPAALFLAEAATTVKLRALGRVGAGAVAVLLALAVPRLAITVLSWFHPSVHFPARPLPDEHHGQPKPWPFTGLRQPPPPAYRLQAFSAEWPPVAAAVKAHCRGRVLVREWMLAEWLSTATEVPVIGGFLERNLGHGDANLFTRYPDGAMPPGEVADYLERYAIGCLLVSAPTPRLELRADLFRLVASVENRRLYVTVREPSYFAKGDGRVSQGLNRLVVESAAGDEALLRFHWLPTLRCRPGCTVERAEVPGDRVGFLRVPRPPRRFEIYNSYEWPK